MLFPRESETREVRDLSGIWRFRADQEGVGVKQEWPARPLEQTTAMPVPASYNDVTQDAALRDLVGDVWYERTFFVPAAWQGRRVVLRFGSATHHCTAYVNGREVVKHKGGYLPFEADISGVVVYGAENRVTAMVNNILDWTTLPPGQVRVSGGPFPLEWKTPAPGSAPILTMPQGIKEQEYFHDFFNYAGLHRPVRLYCTPKVFVEDITVVTDVQGKEGVVKYAVAVGGGAAPVRVTLLDEAGKKVASAEGAQGELRVKNARLWQPGKAYLYTLVAEALGADGKAGDIYRLPVGIRTIKVTDKQFLINGQPFYFQGFGKHEDLDVRGKGHDDTFLVKDFNLLRWMGANSFRTSHYPYAEEVYDLADREGMVVIGESPAVGMKGSQAFFSKDLTQELIQGEEARLAHHLDVMREMIQRDKNHPSVVMWSVSNEPDTKHERSGAYFQKVAEETRKLDPSRPITLIECLWPHQSMVMAYFDVICVNSYASWYGQCGHLEAIEPQIESLLSAWHARFKKPVFMTEYGADTMAGLHCEPPQMWSEEYQCGMLENYHKVHDKLDFVIGEHVWNFADFMTKQGTGRVIGNRKGVLTRNRQPKMAAHLLRERWTKKKGRK